MPSMQACADHVAQQRPLANGATWGKTSGSRAKECYAEFGQTGVNPKSDWINCYIGGTRATLEERMQLKVVRKCIQCTHLLHGTCRRGWAAGRGVTVQNSSDRLHTAARTGGPTLNEGLGSVFCMRTASALVAHIGHARQSYR